MELCLKAVVHQLIEQAAQRFPRGRALFDLTGNSLEVGFEHLHAAEGQIIREMVDPVKQVQDVRVRLTGLFHICFQFLGRTGGEERVAFYLFKLKECKATAPVGIELLDSNKAF